MYIYLYITQDIISIDSDCTHGNILGHNRIEEMEDNILPLAPYGVQPSIVSIDFYPDWYIV